MLDSIINLVKTQFADTVNKNTDVPADKKDQVVDTATTSVVDSLKSNFTLDNLSSLSSLFGDSNGLSSDKGLTSSLQNSVISVLTQKLGLSKGVADTIASTAIPAILSTFQKKVNDPNQSGFNIESLIKSFSEGDNKKDGGLLGKIGGLFGK